MECEPLSTVLCQHMHFVTIFCYNNFFVLLNYLIICHYAHIDNGIKILEVHKDNDFDDVLKSLHNRSEKEIIEDEDKIEFRRKERKKSKGKLFVNEMF